jgi:hypothetical protein
VDLEVISMSEQDKDHLLNDEKKKIVESLDGIKKFKENFGPSDDIYNDILIEELLKIFTKSA